jgi:adenylyl-sulfate kinase
LPSSGKTTLAFSLEERLVGQGRAAYVLDGDNLRHGLNSDLGFSDTDRSENIRRVGEVAALFADAGLIVVASFISPFVADRQRARAAAGTGCFVEVYVDAPLEVCEARDPRGLYRRARAGQLPGFTGIDAPYEPPSAPDLHLRSAASSIDDEVEAVLDLLVQRGVVVGACRDR